MPQPMKVDMATSRYTRRLASAVVVASVAVLMTTAALWIWPQYAYARERIAADEALSQWLGRRPPDVNVAVWDVATTWAAIAYSNVCFSAEYVPLDELRRFHADVKDRLDEDADLGTIDWVWQRLAATGPHGQAYRERFESQYRASLAAALVDD